MENTILLFALIAFAQFLFIARDLIKHKINIDHEQASIQQNLTIQESDLKPILWTALGILTLKILIDATKGKKRKKSASALSKPSQRIPNN